MDKPKHTVRLKIRYDREWEEFQVQWIEDGRLKPEKTYHTDDREDAGLTAKDMLKRASDEGYTIV